jgi:SPP1 family predicted phage head-tail adaptor
MEPGRLRHRVTLEELLTEQDSDGAVSEAWTPISAPVSAEILPLSGRELLAAAATQSKVATRIVIRYRPGFSTMAHPMRVVHRDTIYSIEAVIPDNKSGRQWLTLQCSSGVRYVRQS